MNKTWFIVIGGTLIVLVAGIVQFFPRSAVSPSLSENPSPSLENSSTTPSGSQGVTSVTVSASSPRAVPDRVSMAKGDSVASWDFKGAYADNSDLIAKAEAEISRLTGLIGKGNEPDVNLYVGIANQYELLGDGKQEYEYLSRAIGLGEITGLPWHNLGVLMERLGALETARVAYENSTLIQPEIKFYHYAYLEFLTARMKDNAAAIEKEFAAAIKYLGQDTDILQLYSEWKKV